MTQTSPDENHRVPVPVGRFLWERLLMMSDLPHEDRFKLLALGIFMDGETGEGARPGAANLALFGHHEETWKQLLRRTVDAGWLILRERGGSRKGPNGTRIRKASRYAASVPAEVYDRRREILGAPPFRASKEARERPSQDGSALPSKTGPSTNEAAKASFNAPPPVDNPPAPLHEGSLPSYEGSAETLRSTPTEPTPESTKEASSTYEGSADGLRRKPHCASPSTSPSSHSSTSKIRSDQIRSATNEAPPADGDTPGELGDAVQDRKGIRWLNEKLHAEDAVAELVIRQVRADAHARRIPIHHMPNYLAKMHANGSLIDIVMAAHDHVEGRATPWGASTPDAITPSDDPEPGPAPLHAIDGTGRSSGSAPTQSPLLAAVPEPAPEPPGPNAEFLAAKEQLNRRFGS